MLKGFKCIHPSVIQEQTCVVILRNLSQQVPEVIAPQQVSAVMEEFAHISAEVLDYDPHESLDDIWQPVFSLKCEDWAPRYRLVGKLINALLFLAHGNLDAKRGFSENRRMLHECSKLSITSVDGLRAIRSFAKRYGQDPLAAPLKPEPIRAARGSCKQYQKRLAVGDQPAAEKT